MLKKKRAGVVRDDVSFAREKGKESLYFHCQKLGHFKRECPQWRSSALELHPICKEGN